MNTNLLIEIHFDSDVLPCFLRSDYFKHPLKVHEITEVKMGVFRKVMMYYRMLKKYGIQLRQRVSQ